MALIHKKSRINFKEVVDQAYDHIVITDANGKIRYANPAVSLTTGYPHKEVLGKTPRLWGGLMSNAFYKSFWVLDSSHELLACACCS